jgi:toxin YoeB
LTYGTGKPEPLKGDLAGFWSRRIDRERRLVYRATDTAI